MWMKRSSTLAKGATQRNFLRENMLLVSSRPRPMSTLPHLKREQCRWTMPLAGYELPTVSSIARRVGTLPLVETQRPLIHGGRGFYYVGNVGGGQRSEKQIQTEDISDEQFLNAALLKCTEQAHGQANVRCLRGCSEGDELPVASSSYNSCPRRTTSNFELGSVTHQRGSYQSVPIAQHRPPADVASTLPGNLNPAAVSQLPDNVMVAKAHVADNASVTSPQVQQMAIPEITDVENQPQLDQPLSARTTASSNCPAEETLPEAVVVPEQVVSEPVEKRVLLTEEQRMGLIQAAQARYRELIQEYNRLPLAMGTLRVRNIKIQLEQQLDRIDRELSVLMLPLVYIRRDQLQQISMSV